MPNLSIAQKATLNAIVITVRAIDNKVKLNKLPIEIGVAVDNILDDAVMAIDNATNTSGNITTPFISSLEIASASLGNP